MWGKSDNIRVTDVLNPLDIREPGLTDIEDLRFPVTMSRLDYYIGDWSLTGIAIHEIRFNKRPEYGSNFYPGSQPPPHEDKPDHCGNNTEYAVEIGGGVIFYQSGDIVRFKNIGDNDRLFFTIKYSF